MIIDCTAALKIILLKKKKSIIIHCLEVSCKEDQLTSVQRE